MNKSKLTLIAVLVGALGLIQIAAFCCKPKVEFKAQTADRASLETEKPGDVSVVAKAEIVPETVSEPEAVEKPAAALALNLELVGTAVGNAKDPIAFIKDLDTNKQGIYKTGSAVGPAKVIRIAKGIVDLDHNGKTMTIEVKNRKSQYDITVSDAILSVNDNEIVVSRNELNKSTSSIFKLANKVKIRPFRQSDKVLGMKVDNIDKGCIIEQVGLRNKDIVTSVNNQKIDSYQKALQVFKKIRKQNEIKVSLLREGELKQLCYRIE
jgi:type II secretion system protein C